MHRVMRSSLGEAVKEAPSIQLPGTEERWREGFPVETGLGQEVGCCDLSEMCQSGSSSLEKPDSGAKRDGNAEGQGVTEAPGNCSWYLEAVLAFFFVCRVIFGGRFSQMAWKKPETMVKRFNFKEIDVFKGRKNSKVICEGPSCLKGCFPCLFSTGLLLFFYCTLKFSFWLSDTRESTKVTAGPGGPHPVWRTILLACKVSCRSQRQATSLEPSWGEPWRRPPPPKNKQNKKTHHHNKKQLAKHGSSGLGSASCSFFPSGAQED